MLWRRPVVHNRQSTRKDHRDRPVGIEAQKQEECLALKRRGHRRGADVFFLDEAEIRSYAPVQRTGNAWDQTPVVATSGQRQVVSAISVVNLLGAFWYNVCIGRLNAGQFIVFLKDFLRYRWRRVSLVVDRHRAHIGRIVAKYVRSVRGKLELHFLSGYARDLNSDEFVWDHLRQEGVSKTPLRRNESLRPRVEADLAAIRANPPLARSFFSYFTCVLYCGVGSNHA